MKKEKTARVRLTKNNRMVIYTLLAMIAAAVALTAFAVMICTGGVGKFRTDYSSILGMACVVLFMLMILYIYYDNRGFLDVKRWKTLAVSYSVLFLTVLASVGAMKYIDEFAAPIAISAVMPNILLNRRMGFVTSAFASLITLVVYLGVQLMMKGAVSAAAFVGVTIAFMQAYCMMYLINRNYTRFKLLWGALAVGVAFVPIAMAAGIIVYSDWREVLLSGAFSFAGNVITVFVFTAAIPLYEGIFDVWTDFKLAESCSMSRPLLRRLSDEAPGTFNHCIIVSNLCESCALAIGENPFLAKACGIYHDVGKLTNPGYFVENQTGEYSPHDELIPEVSVGLITNHTTAGYNLLKENHLPEEIARVAKEHHGTTMVRFFYNKACSMTENRVDESLFAYQGPKPSTKIAAIVMISDVSEAACRANTPGSTRELEKLIGNIINDKIRDNQFSNCDITFKDLEKIKRTIVKVMPAVFHKRIDYNGGNK